MKRVLELSCVAILYLAVVAPSSAVAGGFDAQRFVPAAGAAGGLMVERPVVPLHLGYGAGLFASYAFRPVVVTDDATGEIAAKPLAHALTLDVLASLGLFDWLELAVHLPVQVVYTGDDVVFGGQPLAASSGVGDLRLMPKVAWWLGGSPSLSSSIGFALGVSLPTGSDEAMRGTGAVSLEPRALFELGAARWSFTANLGYRGRLADQSLDPAGGQALTYGVSGLFNVVHGSVGLDLMAELDGSWLPSSSQPGSVKAPFELLGGVVVSPAREWNIYVAVGPGLTSGLGTPDFRGIVGVRYAHRVPGRDRFTDTDGDRIPDYRDDCRQQPEDYDGYEDEDGCPDPDNDNDGVADDLDECPTQAEERGGDGDGCPDRGHVIIKRGHVYIFGKVLFRTESAQITERSGPLLDQIAEAVREHDEIGHLTIVGHTDNTGDAAFNLRLSRKRAESVKAALVERGVDASRLSTRGRGEADPIAPNETPAGRARNRRVDFQASHR